MIQITTPPYVIHSTNIIFGLALGYKSCIIPALTLAAIIFATNSLAGMYGVACSALGMLSTLATCLAIDAYGPISVRELIVLLQLCFA